MELIPAIDVLNNIVVKAFAGERKKYKPITSKITRSFYLNDIISSLLDEYSFKSIYIADLNSIMGKNDNFQIINDAIEKFPNINFWVDYGIKSFSEFNKIQNKNFKIIIGSETIINISELKKIVQIRGKEFILSLDFKNNAFLGPINLLKEQNLWPKKVIYMCLDQVGNKRILKKFNNKIFNFNKKNHFYLAGGISDNKDILFLESLGFKGVLAASSIHERLIDYKIL
tara:strand:+ start:123 stop:806 length:684 start_codon:yes stop_codon:yes gene_type:complete